MAGSPKSFITTRLDPALFLDIALAGMALVDMGLALPLRQAPEHRLQPLIGVSPIGVKHYLPVPPVGQFISGQQAQAFRMRALSPPHLFSMEVFSFLNRSKFWLRGDQYKIPE